MCVKRSIVRDQAVRPTALLFGRNKEGFDLYVTNAAFPFFQVPPPRLPSLLRLKLEVHGLPQ